MGITPFFYALVVAFVAGLSSPPLVVAAVGIALGLVESWTTLVLPTTWTALVVFGILFIYVALRPLRRGLASA
jgi:branched-subunit amino acid ABC-type transport system permease component